MLAGDNSILQRATEAKEKTERVEIVENAKIDVLNEIAENKGNDLQESQLKNVLEKYFIKSEIPEELPNDLSTLELTTQNQKYKIKVSEIYDGNFISVPKVPLPAKDILKVTISGDTVTSPYYVNYPSAKGTIKCRVLYNDNDEKGLQIISVNPVTKVTLGTGDTNPNVTGSGLAKAQNSYNRAITTLNEKAEEYIATSTGQVLAIDARCVGSDPVNKNYPDNLTGTARTAEMYVADSRHTYMKDYNGKYFKSDTNYETDRTRLDKIGAAEVSDITNGSEYWLASRNANYGTGYYDFSVKLYNWGSIFSPNGELWGVEYPGETSQRSPSEGLRPVFTLAPEVKIIRGEGTEAVPFEIGL